MEADYQLCFINSLISEFQKSKDHRDESFIILPDLFELPNLSYPLKYPTVNSMK